MKNCPKCKGKGTAKSGRECPACQGKGQVTQDRYKELQQILQGVYHTNRTKTTNWSIV